jgi:hypothetical protein
VPHILWFAAYALDGIVFVVGVAFFLSLLPGRAESATTSGFAARRITFSILDLLLLTLVCSLVISAIRSIPPNLAEFEYCYDFADTVRLLSTTALLTIPAMVIVFRDFRAAEVRARVLILTIGVTLIGGVLAASLFGVRANPLWAAYALSPGSTATFVALALLVQRSAESRP